MLLRIADSKQGIYVVMFTPKVILHPTDFSECSRYAWQIAVDLAEKYQARIAVLHVVETLGPSNVTFGEVATELEPGSHLNRLREDLRRLQPSAPGGVQVDYLLVEGDPARGIERVAQEQHCDLVVMGTHGHQGLQRLLMGSVAEKVVRRIECAVLTVKLPKSAVS